MAIAVGRALPGLAGGARWPYRVLGLGYAVLAVGILVIGAVRQHRTADALRRGGYDQLSAPLVTSLTAVAIALSITTLTVVAVGL